MSKDKKVRRAAWGAVAGLAIALLPSHASAAPILNITYDAAGTSTIARTGSTIDLGPAELETELDFATGEFTGSMPLPGTETRFEIIGLIPVTADVAFEEVVPVTGIVKPGTVSGSAVESVATYYIRLSNIKVVGFPTITGSHCRTVDPVAIEIGTPAAGGFNVFHGGTLSGEFSIGNFQNCGVNTWLINLLIPGGGNTVEVELSNGHLS